jgi:hypothetical protein
MDSFVFAFAIFVRPIVIPLPLLPSNPVYWNSYSKRRLEDSVVREDVKHKTK